MCSPTDSGIQIQTHQNQWLKAVTPTKYGNKHRLRIQVKNLHFKLYGMCLLEFKALAREWKKENGQKNNNHQFRKRDEKRQ